MNLHELSPAAGANKQPYRKGRGAGSGNGKTGCQYGVKILGNGNLTKKLHVQASAFSASAKEKIVAAGGKYEVI